MFKKKMILILNLLIIIFILSACSKKEEEMPKSELVDANPISANEDISTIDISDLKEDESKIRIYLEETELPIYDNFSAKLHFSNDDDSWNADCEISKNEPVTLITLPKNEKEYNIEITEKNGPLEVKIQDKLMVNTDANIYKIKIPLKDDITTIDVSDLDENDTRVRIYLEEMDQAIPDNFSTKIRFTSYYNAWYLDYELSKDNPLIEVTLPKDKYNVEVLETNGPSEVKLEKELVKFYTSANTYRINVLTNGFTSNGTINDVKADENEDQVVRKNTRNTRIRMNIICIILLLGSVGFIIYRKKKIGV